MVRHRAARACLAAATGLVLVLGPVAATAVAQPFAAADISVDRSMGLAGVQNARDAGGYRTLDGRWVRTGLVYRSGQLTSATPADLAVLSARGVVVVDDLRTGYERALAPDRIPADTVQNWDDVLGQAPPQTLVSTLVGGVDMYRAFITSPGANVAFAAVLRDIIDTSDGAVLYHCTAGKDRTGWASAVLLTVLGVDRDTVRQDYMLSNRFRNADEKDPLNGVQAAWLDSAFSQVEQSYGTFDAYVRQGLKLSDSEITALKSKLLA